MILSDRDIRAELEAGRIVIDPYLPEAVQPSSVDLHLGMVRWCTENLAPLAAQFRFEHHDVEPGLGKRLLAWRPEAVRRRQPRKPRRHGRSWIPGGRR